MFGAIYLDSGYDSAKTVIKHCFAGQLAELPDAESLRDPKTRLQEWLQARGRALPEYALDSVTGKAHKQHFEVTCSLGDSAKSARGEGSSRRRAEQAAARSMLELLTGSNAA